jgi:hypothetical protein
MAALQRRIEAAEAKATQLGKALAEQKKDISAREKTRRKLLVTLEGEALERVYSNKCNCCRETHGKCLLCKTNCNTMLKSLE